MASSSRRPVLRNRTIVDWWAAKDCIFSLSGTGVRPSMRVMTTLWEMPGRVYSSPRAAAAPEKELTPGHTS